MSSGEIHELAVALRPEGIEETTSGLERTQGTFEETADVAQEQSSRLEGFAEQWQGAMTAILAGLGVAAAGLASRVPVIGETMAGLEAIIRSVAIQIDQFLRPVLAEVTTELFDLADQIARADKNTGDLIGAIGTLIIVVGGLTGALFAAGSVLGAFGFGPGGVAAVSGVVRALTGAISGLIGEFAAIPGAITAGAVAIGVLVGLFSVAALEISGLMDLVRGFGQFVSSVLPQWFTDLALVIATPLLAGFATIGAAIAGFVSGTLRGGLEAGIDQAVENVKGILQVFVGAWQRTLDRVIRIVERINEAVRSIRTPSGFFDGLSDGTIGGGGGGGDRGGGGGGGNGGGGGDGPFAEQRRQIRQLMSNTGDTVLEIDGREVARATERFQGEDAANSGRNGVR